MRRLFVVLMVVAMVCSFAMPALADEELLFSEEVTTAEADAVTEVMTLLESLENAVAVEETSSESPEEADEEPSGEAILAQTEEQEAVELKDDGELPVILVIGGVTVSKENMADVMGDGTVTYDADTNTLTLHNADIVVNDGNYGIRNTGSLNIVLRGTNRVVCAGVYGLYSTDDVVIGGDGTLEVRGSDLGICVAGGYEVGGLTVCDSVSVTAVGGNVTSGSSYGVRVDDVLSVCDRASLIAKGGAAPERSCGIYAYDIFEVSGAASVTAVGGDLSCSWETDSCGIRTTHVVVNSGSVDANGGTAGSSNGIFASTFDMYGGTVTAIGGVTEGAGPSVGLQANKTLNLSGGVIEATAGSAGDDQSCGILTGGGTASVSGGTIVANGGDANYSYGLKAHELIVNGGFVNAVGGNGTWCSTGISAENNMKISSGGVDAKGSDAQNFSYGVQTSAAEVSGGTVYASAGGANASYGFWAFSKADILCDEVTLNLNSPTFSGTRMHLSSDNGYAFYVFENVVLDDSLTVSEPEGGAIQKGSEGAPEGYTVVDQNGEAARSAVIEPLVYKVTIHVLESEAPKAARVPVGESVNGVYCERFGVEDFSEILVLDNPGFTFGGWRTESGEVFDFDMPVTSDMEVYAEWVSEDAPDDAGTPGELSPKTGDSNFLWLWTGMVILSGAAVIFLQRKKG